LEQLQTSYIWNIYKQMVNDVPERSAEIPYSELEQNFKKDIMEPLADHILRKTVSEDS